MVQGGQSVASRRGVVPGWPGRGASGVCPWVGVPYLLTKREGVSCPPPPPGPVRPLGSGLYSVALATVPGPRP